MTRSAAISCTTSWPSSERTSTTTLERNSPQTAAGQWPTATGIRCRLRSTPCRKGIGAEHVGISASTASVLAVGSRHLSSTGPEVIWLTAIADESETRDQALNRRWPRQPEQSYFLFACSRALRSQHNDLV